MNAILPLKLFLVPALIFAITHAGRRWGPAVAGWMSAFPVVAGPVLLAITLEQGAGFAAAAAEGTLLAVLAILVFSIAYAWTSLRFGVAGSMACALAAYALSVAGLQALHPPLPVCYALVLVSLFAAPRLFPPDTASSVPGGQAASGDLPWRMLAGAVLVMTVSWAASSIGPRLSGFFAMFPVMGSVLTGFTHASAGRPAAVQLLRGAVKGYFAFATFCLLLATLLNSQGTGLAFLCALGGALAVTAGVARYYRPARSAA